MGESYDPAEAERRCQVFKSHVRCTQEQREQAVRESCWGNLTISQIAAIYNVTPSAVSVWRRKLLGKGRKKTMPTTPDEAKDVIQLKKETGTRSPCRKSKERSIQATIRKRCFEKGFRTPKKR